MTSREPPSPRSLGWFPSCFLDEGFDAHRVWEPAFQRLSARDANSIAEGIIAAAASTEVSLDLSEASFEVDQALTELLYNLRFPRNSSSEAVEDVVELVEVSPSLLRLSLSHCRLEPHCLEQLLTAISWSPSLTCLDLSHSKLGDSGARLLAQGLPEMRHLSRLSLCNTGVGCSGVEELCFYLPSSPSLTSLDLSLNQIHSEGALAISALLGPSGHLRALDLSANQLGRTGLEDLRRALRGNTSLVSLRMRAVCSRTGGRRHLAGGVTRSRSLRLLDVRENGLGMKEVQRLERALRANCALLFLDLRSNPFVAAAAAAAELLEGLSRRLANNRLLLFASSASLQQWCLLVLQRHDAEWRAGHAPTFARDLTPPSFDPFHLRFLMHPGSRLEFAPHATPLDQMASCWQPSFQLPMASK